MSLKIKQATLLVVTSHWCRFPCWSNACGLCWWWLVPRLRGLWGNVRPCIPRLNCCLFVCLFVFCFFFKVEIKLRTLIPLIRPTSVYSVSASWEDCGRVFPDELRASSFPDRFPHNACGIASSLWLRWVKGVCVLRCNLPPALLAEWPGSFTCNAVTRGWNGRRIRVSTENWLWTWTFSRRSCRNSNSQPFHHEFGALSTSYPGSHAEYK